MDYFLRVTIVGKKKNITGTVFDKEEYTDYFSRVILLLIILYKTSDLLS